MHLRPLRHVLAGLTVGVALAATASAAEAADPPSIAITDGNLVIVDAPGNVLSLDAYNVGTARTIRSSHRLEPLPAGCSRYDAGGALRHGLTCPSWTGHVAIDLGDGPDHAFVRSSAGPILVIGGLGDDTISVTHSRAGRNVFVFGDRFGAPSWLDGDDTIAAGTDESIPSRADSVVYANAGDDTVTGSRNADELHGGPGRDALSGGDGADTLWGDDGDDLVQGNKGADTVTGGAGADDLRGGAGRDVLEARDGRADTAVDCGKGDGVADVVGADPADPLRYCP